MSEEQEPKLRVKDRRMFNLDGSPRTPDPDDEPRETVEAPTAPSAAPASAAPATGGDVISIDSRERSADRAADRTETPAPEPAAADDDPGPAPGPRHAEPSLFGELVHSLAYQAAMLMGLVKDPLGPQYPADMRGARQTIEMIGMLKEKTRGNLTPEESVALERILTDLRMQFVAMTQGGGGGIGGGAGRLKL